MKNYKNKKYTSTDILIGLFLFIIVAVIPLVTKLSTVPLRGDEINVIRSGTGYNDVFSYTKSVLIMCMGIVTAIFLSFELFGNDQIKLNFKSYPVILAGIFAVLAILSALFSNYLSVAFMGATERYEGLFVWLCYIVFFITAITYSSEKKRAKLLILCLMASGLFLGIIGLLQVFHIPIFETDFVSKLVMGDQYTGTNLAIKFTSVFATLYNPNCAGMYFGMMASLFIILAIFLPIKSKLKYASILIGALTLISTIGSSSVGGFLGLACGIALSMIVAVCYSIFKKKSKSAAVISIVSIVIIIIAGIVFLNSNSTTAQKIKIIYNTITSGQTLENSDNFYKDITLDGKNGNIITAGGVYTVAADGENSKLLHDGIELTPVITEPATEKGGIHNKYNENNIVWDLYIYSNISNTNSKSVSMLSLISTDSLGNDRFFMFSQQADGNICFLDKFNNPVDINEKIPRIGFEGIERLGSNRGYIWSRSLPLVFNNIIIGSGPDTFEFEFPQKDVISKLNYLNDPYVILDKPHNMYLQYAINTGLISLIVLLLLFIGYIIQTIKAIFNDTDSFNIAIRLGVLAAVTAYLAAGFTTDSVVSVAPVFWVILGMGYGSNLIGRKFMTREEKQLEKMRKKIK